MSNTHFSDQIRSIRHQQQLSMQKLADLLHVSKSAVNMWENKGIVPRPEILQNISALFRITLDDLLGNSTIYPKKQSKTLQSILNGLENMNESELNLALDLFYCMFPNVFNKQEIHL